MLFRSFRCYGNHLSRISPNSVATLTASPTSSALSICQLKNLFSLKTPPLKLSRSPTRSIVSSSASSPPPKCDSLMFSVPVYEIDWTGECRIVQKTLADLSQLKHSSQKLPIRDMRMFFASAKMALPASILPRPASNCFLISLEHLQIFCQKDQCLVLHPENGAVRSFVDNLKGRIVTARVRGSRSLPNIAKATTVAGDVDRGGQNDPPTEVNTNIGDAQPPRYLRSHHHPSGILCGVPGQGQTETRSSSPSVSARSSSSRLMGYHNMNLGGPTPPPPPPQALFTNGNGVLKNETSVNVFLNALITDRENTTFEMIVLELTLQSVTNKLKRHINLLKPILDLILQETSANPNASMLRRLLAFRKSLSAFEMSVVNVRTAVCDILKEKEDLMGLCLTRKNCKLAEDEAELLLEAYAADLKEIECDLQHMKDQIEDTNDFINMHLNSIRNRIIKVSLFMEMGTMAMGFGALIAGIFGMNLTSGLETNSSAFAVVCGGILVMVGTMFGVFFHRYISLNRNFSSARNYQALKHFFGYVDVIESYLHENNCNSSSFVTKSIDKYRFRKLLEPVIGSQLTQAQVDAIFKMFDANSDDCVDITELTNSSSSLLQNVDDDDRVSVVDRDLDKSDDPVMRKSSKNDFMT